VSKFNKVNKDKITPQHPQHDSFEWVTAYTFKCVSSGLINNKYAISLKGDHLFEVSCPAKFVEQLMGLLNGAYNTGRSDMKLEAELLLLSDKKYQKEPKLESGIIKPDGLA